jgi:predicted RNase H-like HicB family nuclease
VVAISLNLNYFSGSLLSRKDEEVGEFIASCPGLSDCFSQGDTIEVAIENIKEAVHACIESLAED